MRTYPMSISLIPVVAAFVMAPAAQADDAVTYEVASSDIATANVEYWDSAGRKALENVALPWRTNATVANAHSNDARVRADWHSAAGRYQWVTVRVYTHGNLVCETMLDVGDATCFGSGPYYLPMPPYSGCPPPVLLSCGGAYRP